MRRLSDEELARFREEGYLVAKQFIPHDIIQALRAEIAEVIDRRARELAAQGKIAELHENLDVEHRATELHRQCPEILAPVSNGTHVGPAIFGLITAPAILNVMAQLLGPEIVASSVYRLRPKLPYRPEGIVPWHQDQGYFGTCADEHLIVTCWVPLMDATVETGCMEVLPRSHRHGVLRHYWADNPAPPLTIHPDHLPPGDPVPVPATIGDAVLLTNLTAHHSTANRSGRIRWAADLRYNAPEAGDYYPMEAGFLARSHDPAQVTIRDTDDFVRLRREHVRQGTVDRTWMKEADETFRTGPVPLEAPA